MAYILFGMTIVRNRHFPTPGMGRGPLAEWEGADGALSHPKSLEYDLHRKSIVLHSLCLAYTILRNRNDIECPLL